MQQRTVRSRCWRPRRRVRRLESRLRKRPELPRRLLLRDQLHDRRPVRRQQLCRRDRCVQLPERAMRKRKLRERQPDRCGLLLRRELSHGPDPTVHALRLQWVSRLLHELHRRRRLRGGRLLFDPRRHQPRHLPNAAAPGPALLRQRWLHDGRLPRRLLLWSSLFHRWCLRRHQLRFGHWRMRLPDVAVSLGELLERHPVQCGQLFQRELPPAHEGIVRALRL